MQYDVAIASQSAAVAGGPTTGFVVPVDVGVGVGVGVPVELAFGAG